MSDLREMRVQVRAKGATGFYFQVSGSNPTLPRTGEFVEFSDGLGKVESVTWKITNLEKRWFVLVVVECVLHEAWGPT